MRLLVNREKTLAKRNTFERLGFPAYQKEAESQLLYVDPDDYPHLNEEALTEIAIRNGEDEKFRNYRPYTDLHLDIKLGTPKRSQLERWGSKRRDFREHSLPARNPKGRKRRLPPYRIFNTRNGLALYKTWCSLYTLMVTSCEELSRHLTLFPQEAAYVSRELRDLEYNILPALNANNVHVRGKPRHKRTYTGKQRALRKRLRYVRHRTALCTGGFEFKRYPNSFSLPVKLKGSADCRSR